MKTSQILAIVLLYLAALGGISAYLTVQGIAEPPWTAMLTTLVGSLLIFWWYRTDSTLRSYRRSPLLNVAVIGIGIFAVTYYVLRSREKGQRLRAFVKMIGFMALMVGAFFVGALPVALLG